MQTLQLSLQLQDQTSAERLGSSQSTHPRRPETKADVAAEVRSHVALTLERADVGSCAAEGASEILAAIDKRRRR